MAESTIGDALWHSLGEITSMVHMYIKNDKSGVPILGILDTLKEYHFSYPKLNLSTCVTNAIHVRIRGSLKSVHTELNRTHQKILRHLHSVTSPNTRCGLNGKHVILIRICVQSLTSLNLVMMGVSWSIWGDCMVYNFCSYENLQYMIDLAPCER